MKSMYIVLCMLMLGNTVSWGQKYFTKFGHVAFYSDTPLEKIEAHNKSSNCVLDIETGKLEFGVLIKGFQFEKALMQEHFNENYLESNKYPKATFKGQIDQYNKMDVSKNSKTTVKVSGDLTMHGITKKVSTDVVMEVNKGKILANAVFDILVADFNIAIPSLVKDQIAKSVKVKVDVTLDKL